MLLPAPTFPRVLMPAWRAADAGTQTPRRCDALDADTPHRRLTTTGGDYWLCAHTGQLQRDDFGTPDSAHYDAWWRDHIGQGDPQRQIDRHKRTLARYERFRQSGALFEIGCGEGLLLKAAVELGWRAAGNDVSAVATDHAGRLTGATMFTGFMEEIQLPAAAYDVILCNNVFEHLTEPRRVLRHLADALRPGGVIYLQTLNAQSWGMKARPTDWLYFGAGHLHVPTLVSMRKYLAAAGLTPIEQRTHGFRVGAGGHYRQRPWWQRRLDKLVASAAGRVGRGHRVEYLLRKDA